MTIVYNSASKIFLFFQKKILILFYLSKFLSLQATAIPTLLVFNFNPNVQKTIPTWYFFAYSIAFFFLYITIFSGKGIIDPRFSTSFTLFARFRELSRASCQANRYSNKAGFMLFTHKKVFSSCLLGCELLSPFLMLIGKVFLMG